MSDLQADLPDDPEAQSKVGGSDTDPMASSAGAGQQAPAPQDDAAADTAADDASDAAGRRP